YRPVATAPGRMGDADARVRGGLGETIDDLTVALISVPSVHGRIVGDDDSPCATGIVALQGRESGQTFAAMSGGGGSIVLQAVLPDTYDVVAACEGSALPGPLLPIIVADRDIVGLQWTTTAGHAIRGRVLDSTGAPVDGAFVSVFAAGPGASPVQMSARSGSDGTFEVAGALPGTYLMGARHRTLGELSKGDVVVADQDIEVELQLPRTRAIRGRVVDESGAAQAGVDVTMRQPYERTVTRDDGTFTLASIPPGQHRVTAQRSIGDVSAATSVELGPDADADIEITLPTRDRTISGRVLDEDGDAVRDAIVSALPDAVMDERGRDYAMRQLRGLSGFGRGRPPILTDAEGRFEISVHDGEAYTVMAQRRGGGDEWKTGVAAGASVTLEIPARASISGRIVTEAGEGATGLTVRLRNTSSGATLQESFLFAGGRFRFDELGAGPYELVAVAKEGRTRADLELDAGAEQTGLAYTLIGGVTVRGQVVDVTNGKPVGGMLVIVGPETDEIDHFATEAERAMVFSKEGHQTDEEGRFEIVDVPPGALRVMVLPLKMGKGPYGRAMFAMATAGLQPVNELQPIPIAPLPGGIDGKVPPPSFTLQASGPWCTDTPVVDTVVPGSGAAAAGLAKGDIIVAVDGHDVKDRRCHLASRLTMTPAGASVDLTLEDGREVTVRAAP
ncbi:MAG: carboxypeptidase regulatory-like domain-containing protein, partial [Myxococcota bacterium]